MLSGIINYRRFIRLAALVFWTQEELVNKCYEKDRTLRDRDQRQLYEREKYEVLRSKWFV